jgi:hypothetical protein
MSSTLYSCPILTKTELCRQIFEKYSNAKVNENPSSDSRVVRCGRTDRLTDMTVLIVAFRNFVKAPKNFASLIRINDFNPYPANVEKMVSS